MAARPDMLTLEDLYRLPGDDGSHELDCGRLISEPPPGARHGRIAMRLGFALEGHAREHANGVVLTCDTSFVLRRNPDTVRAPDVAWVNRERYLALADESRPIPGPPDLAVEVLSPRDRPNEMHAKVRDYLTAGASLVWVVDPQNRQVCIHQPLAEADVLCIGDVLTAPRLLPGFSMAISDLFRAAFGD